MRRFELEAKQEGFLLIPFFQPVHREVGVDVGGIPFPFPSTFAPVEGRIEILALPFYHHVLAVSLGLTFEVPFTNQPSLVTRLAQLDRILWRIFLDASVQTGDTVFVTVLPGQNGSPTGRTD